MNKIIHIGIIFISFASHGILLPGWSWKDLGNCILKGYELPCFKYTVDLSPQNGLPTESVLLESVSVQTQLENTNPSSENLVCTADGRVIPVIRRSFDDFRSVNSLVYRAYLPKHYIFFKRNCQLSQDNQNVEAAVSYTIFPLPILFSIGLISWICYDQTMRTKISNYCNRLLQGNKADTLKN
jgi:hypothetical protein